MKRLLLLALSPFISLLSFSQSTELWGMLSEGGADNQGVIFKTDQNGENYEIVHSFYRNYGSNPTKRLFFDGVQTVYGTTSDGGKHDGGVLFSFDLVSNEIIGLHHFENTNGSKPMGGVELINNKIYGTTNLGGASDMGVLYVYDLNTNAYQVLEEFVGANGANPEDGVIEHDGILYGLTKLGGSNSIGTVYSLDTATATLSTVYNFTSSDGAYPLARFVLSDVQNKMYTTASEGGSGDFGSILELDLLSNSLTKIHDFDSLNGANPESGLILNEEGHLMGITKNGGDEGVGVIYALDTMNLTFGKINDLDSLKGLHSTGELEFSGNSGVYYATTTLGGINDDGTFLSVNLSDSSLTLIEDMDGAIASKPQGKPFVMSGNIYALGYDGCIDNYGALLAYDISNDSLYVAQTFSCVYGKTPYGTVLDGEDGYLYGMTFFGGNYRYGTIFKYDKNQDTLITIHHFSPSDGAYPYGSLTLGANGKIWGMVTQGGPVHKGAVFSIDKVTNTYTIEAAFNNANGRYPKGDMFYGSDGNMYGMAIYGSLYDGGVIFRVDTVNHAIEELYPFETATGRYPYRNLVEYNGMFYGLTTRGGDNDNGVIFEYDYVNNIYNVLHHFDTPTGRQPYSNLIVDQNGNLFGNTNTGGANNWGVMFKYALSDDSYTVLHEFDFTDGGQPQPSLTFSQNGKMYGLSFRGGNVYKGVLYEYDTLTSTFTNKLNLSASLGGVPYCRMVEIATCPVVSTPFSVNDCSSFTTPQGQTASSAGNYVLTDTLTSHCGGDSLIVYSVFIGDTLDPVPQMATLPLISAYCEIDNPTLPYAIDNCEDTVYAIADVSFPLSDTSIHQINWTMEDNAGNQIQQVQNISWLEMDLTVMQNSNVLAVANANADSYKWMNCDSNTLVAGATNSIYIAGYNGSYAVIITMEGCVDTSECLSINSVGLTELSNSDWLVYPNPSSGKFNIQVPPNVNGPIEMEVVDVFGRVVLRKICTSDQENFIDLGTKKNGVYFIQMKNGSESVRLKIILKNK